MTPTVNDLSYPGGSDLGGDAGTVQLYHPPDREKAAFKAVFRRLRDPEVIRSHKYLITPHIHHPLDLNQLNLKLLHAQRRVDHSND